MISIVNGFSIFLGCGSSGFQKAIKKNSQNHHSKAKDIYDGVRGGGGDVILNGLNEVDRNQ